MDVNMSLVKTEKGRKAMLSRDASMTHRERQILLICDGKRTRAEMRAMFTADITEDFKRLFALKLIVDVSQQAITPENMSGTGTFRVSALGEFPHRIEYRDTTGFGSIDTLDSQPSSPDTQPLRQAAAPVATAPLAAAHRRAALMSAAAPKVRRSMAAAKMYMVDILQRIRDMDSPAFAVAIQTSTNESELVSNLLNAIRYIHSKSSETFSTRVFEKLYEIIPEDHLFKMEALAVELEGNSLYAQ
jgi:hypothetical protein